MDNETGRHRTPILSGTETSGMDHSNYRFRLDLKFHNIYYSNTYSTTVTTQKKKRKSAPAKAWHYARGSNDLL